MLTRQSLDVLFNSQCLRKSPESVCSVLEENALILKKEKQIYSTLNLSRQQDAVYVINCWVPASKEKLVMTALK